jgi:hypothetical protein
MARGSAQRFKAILLCFGLECLVLTMCTALGSTQPCITPEVVGIADPANVPAASRRDACLDTAAAGSSLGYDLNSARCVQGPNGCDEFATL